MIRACYLKQQKQREHFYLIKYKLTINVSLSLPTINFQIKFKLSQLVSIKNGIRLSFLRRRKLTRQWWFQHFKNWQHSTTKITRLSFWVSWNLAVLLDSQLSLIVCRPAGPFCCFESWEEHSETKHGSSYDFCGAWPPVCQRFSSFSEEVHQARQKR